MRIKLLKNLLCFITATVALNAQAVFIAELDQESYGWMELNETTGLSHAPADGSLKQDAPALVEYEYTTRELKEELERSYVPWNTSEWQGSDSFLDSVSITAGESSESLHGDESPSVKVLLLIISGIIGIFGLTKDRSHEED